MLTLIELLLLNCYLVYNHWLVLRDTVIQYVHKTLSSDHSKWDECTLSF